jgi:HK97 gp10 family phage protein
MEDFELKVSGLDALIQKFENAPAKAEKHFSGVLSKYLALMKRDAKANAPVDTKALRDSIRAYRVGKISGMFTAGNPDMINAKGRRVIYAGYQEFGVGGGFHIPGFHTISRSAVFNYAYLFKNKHTPKKSYIPYRSYMFTSLDNNYEKMLNEMAAFKI